MSLSIRGKIVSLLTVFGLLPPLAVFGIFLFFYGSFEKTQTTPVVNAVQSLAERSSNDLTALIGRVQLLAASPIFADSDNHYDRGLDNPVISAMNKFTARNSAVDAIVLVDDAGDPLLVNHISGAGGETRFDQFLDNFSYADQALVARLEDAAELRKVAEAGGIILKGFAARQDLDLLLDAPGKSAVIIVPIFNAYGGYAGAVAAYVSDRVFTPAMEAASHWFMQHGMSGAQLLSLDGDGDAIAGDPAQWQEGKRALSQFIQDIQPGQDRTAHATDHHLFNAFDGIRHSHGFLMQTCLLHHSFQ